LVYLRINAGIQAAMALCDAHQITDPSFRKTLKDIIGHEFREIKTGLACYIAGRDVVVLSVKEGKGVTNVNG
jgi:hypothetical protein